MKQIAAQKCAEWLSACLKLGWRRKDFDFLEALWWKYHDEDTGLFLACALPELVAAQAFPPTPDGEKQP